MKVQFLYLFLIIASFTTTQAQQQQSKIIAKTYSKGTVKKKSDVMGDSIGFVSKGKTVNIISHTNGYYLIETDSIKGYISDAYFINTQEMKDLIKSSAEIQSKKQNALYDANYKKQKALNDAKLIKEYGTVIGNRIINHKIWLGMNSSMARKSIGSPGDINRTVGSWGVHEQWVYNNRYLYFENNILKSWQD